MHRILDKRCAYSTKRGNEWYSTQEEITIHVNSWYEKHILAFAVLLVLLGVILGPFLKLFWHDVKRLEKSQWPAFIVWVYIVIRILLMRIEIWKLESLSVLVAYAILFITTTVILAISFVKILIKDFKKWLDEEKDMTK
jgi:hypothetical protein